jgi:hypothetical protein
LVQPATFGAKPPVTIRPTPPRALGEIGGQARKRLAAVLQAGVHRAHQHAVLQRGEAEVERGEQVRKSGRHDGFAGMR